MEIAPMILVVSSVVPPIIEAIKNSPNFPSITPETKTKLVALSALLTAVGSIAAGITSGAIELDSWAMFGEAAVNFIAAFGITELMYRHVFKRFFDAKEKTIENM